MLGLRKTRQSGSTLDALPSDKQGRNYPGRPTAPPRPFAEEEPVPSAIVTISATARAMCQEEAIVADTGIAEYDAVCYNNTIKQNKEESLAGASAAAKENASFGSDLENSNGESEPRRTARPEYPYPDSLEGYSMQTPQQPVVLFRSQFDSDGESAAAAGHFPVVGLRSRVPAGSLVVGRYACLPYYGEMAADLAENGSRLINSPEQHGYIANFDYYEDIRAHTFPTWFALQDIPLTLRDQPFVVKGRTNSRKLQWKTHMFAENFRRAVDLASDLANDPFIGPQGVIIRQYVPLETLEIGINGTPITNEWRLFFYKGNLLAHGYYWAIIDDLALVEKGRPDFEARGIPLAKMVAGILKARANFFVIDIARTAEGDWRVVEVNDGQQSGLNYFVSAAELYANLAKALASSPI